MKNKNNKGVSYFTILMLIVVFATIAFFVASYFSSPADVKAKQVTAGEFIDDSVITTTVKSKIGVDDFLKSFQVGVETRKGVVQLSGFVDTQKAIDKADEIATSVKGVKSVKNDLIVKESAESAGEYVDDSVITTTIKSKLGVDDFLKSFQVDVKTRQGVVQLSGFVDTQKAIDKADEIANSVKGVKSVKNDLIVKK
jgi:hyperosmotically inducible protein